MLSKTKYILFEDISEAYKEESHYFGICDEISLCVRNDNRHAKKFMETKVTAMKL
ncbi:hypothetical protein GCM10022396_29350 [Flavivirga amylovorans]